MGYKDKKYSKDLHQQAFEKLQSMKAFGESKKEAMLHGTAQDKIYSICTLKTYLQNAKYYVRYLKENHPEVTSLKKSRKYVTEYLKFCETKNESAWTIQTKAKSLAKLFGIRQEDSDYYTPPKRRRRDIKRSRVETVRDRHFSKTNNAELIAFCRATGCRREGLTKLRGQDLKTRDYIETEVAKLVSIEKERNLTPNEKGMLMIYQDALKFDKVNYFLYLKEKNGRRRVSPIIGPNTDKVVERMRNTNPEERVWLSVSTNADIHGYRSDYANAVYKQYARDIEDIPYDKYNPGTGHWFKSEVYHCRGDMRGCSYDRRAMELTSIALGHHRVEIVASNYLRGI